MVEVTVEWGQIMQGPGVLAMLKSLKNIAASLWPDVRFFFFFPPYACVLLVVVFKGMLQGRKNSTTKTTSSGKHRKRFALFLLLTIWLEPPREQGLVRDDSILYIYRLWYLDSPLFFLLLVL